MSPLHETAPDVLMVGPTTGGVGAVFARAVDEVRSRGRMVTAIRLGGGDRPEALIGLRAAWRNRRALRSAHAVHIELGSNDRAVFWFAAAACIARCDCVVIAHDVPQLAHQPGASIVRRTSRARTILAHRVLAPAVDPLARGLVLRRAGHWLVLGDAAVVAWSDEVAGDVSRLHLGWDLSAARGTTPSAGEHVLFAGFLGPTKGVDELLDAWAQAAGPDDPPLLIAGDGDGTPWLDALRTRADAMPIPPRWLGTVDEHSFGTLFARAAIVVLPYRTSSSASGIVVRAMAAGRPILATRVPAIDGLIHDQVEGRITPPGDVPALARALRELLDDPAGRDRMGEAALVRAREELSWSRHVSELERAYDAAGGATGPPRTRG